MKTMLILLVLFCVAKADTETVKYQVSKAGSDKEKLLKVYEAVVAQERMRKHGMPPSVTLTIARVLDDGKFLVHPARMRKPPPPNEMQRLGFLGSSSPPEYDTNKEITCFLELPGRSDLSVHKTIHLPGYRLGDRKTTYEGVEYDTLEPVVDGFTFTKEEFVAALKAGQTWRLVGFEKSECNTCMGDGKLGATRNNAKCQECGGDGILSKNLVVAW